MSTDREVRVSGSSTRDQLARIIWKHWLAGIHNYDSAELAAPARKADADSYELADAVLVAFPQLTNPPRLTYEAMLEVANELEYEHHCHLAPKVRVWADALKDHGSVSSRGLPEGLSAAALTAIADRIEAHRSKDRDYYMEPEIALLRGWASSLTTEERDD